MNTADPIHQAFVRGRFIWLLATLFYFFDILLNVFPAAIKPELLADFNCNAAELGALSASFGWSYAIMQIPAGILIDKFGPRRLFTLASILCAAGTFLFGMAETIFAAEIGRVLIGIGASFAVVGCTKVASIWFAPNRFAFFMGLMISVGFCGPAFGLGMVTQVLSLVGSWRTVMMIATGGALALSVIFWIFVRDMPEQILPWNVTTSLPERKESVYKGIIEIISCKQAWYASIYAGLMFVPTLSFGGLWAIPYLVEAHGISREMAGFLAGQIFIGWIFGGPVYGWISDHLGRRNIPMYVANITTLIVMLILIYAHGLSTFSIGLCMFALGFFSSGFVIAFAVVRENYRTEISATAIGFINTLNTLFPAGFQIIIGKFLDNASTEAGQAVFSLADYQTALLTIPAGLVISLLTLIFLKETYCKPKEV